MTKLTRAALVAATLTLSAAPAAHAVPLPPTDAVDLGFHNGCENNQGDPCDIVITGPDPSVDKTYPSRLAAWAGSILP